MRDDSGSNRAKIRGQYIYPELPLLVLHAGRPTLRPTAAAADAAGTSQQTLGVHATAAMMPNLNVMNVRICGI